MTVAPVHRNGAAATTKHGRSHARDTLRRPWPAQCSHCGRPCCASDTHLLSHALSETLAARRLWGALWHTAEVQTQPDQQHFPDTFTAHASGEDRSATATAGVGGLGALGSAAGGCARTREADEAHGPRLVGRWCTLASAPPVGTWVPAGSFPCAVQPLPASWPWPSKWPRFPAARPPGSREKALAGRQSGGLPACRRHDPFPALEAGQGQNLGSGENGTPRTCLEAAPVRTGARVAVLSRGLSRGPRRAGPPCSRTWRPVGR